MLKSKPGIIHAEILSGRDGDAYTFNIETEVGVDIRKSLFYTLAEKNWPLVGMEALGMSLEDIFVAIVDQTEKGRYERRASRSSAAASSARSTAKRARTEQEVAKTIADKKRGSAEQEFTALFGDDDE